MTNKIPDPSGYELPNYIWDPILIPQSVKDYFDEYNEKEQREARYRAVQYIQSMIVQQAGLV